MELIPLLIATVPSLVAALLANRASRSAGVQAAEVSDVAEALVQDLDDRPTAVGVQSPESGDEGLPGANGRVTRLVESLREAESLIAELEAEMRVRHATVDRLRAEEEKSRQLAALRAEEAEAVKGVIDAAIASGYSELQQKMRDEQAELRARLVLLQKELGKAQQKSRKEQSLFFLAGALLSIPIGFLVNAFS